MEFSLAGQTFHCLPLFPGGVMADLIIAADKPLGVILDAAVALIRGVLVPEDEERWDAAIYGKEHVISAPQIAEIAEWLVEVGLGAPFGQPSDSPRGP